MAGEIQVAFTGTLGGDPEIRQAGQKRVLSVSIAQHARVKRGDEWVDGETWWLSASLWERWDGDRYLDNVAASLKKGALVDVRGQVRLESYQTREGAQGQSHKLQLEAIAPSLQFADAQVTKNQAGGRAQQQSGWDAPAGQQSWGQSQSAPAGDQWGQVMDA